VLHNAQQNFNKIPIKGLVPESSATAPTSPRAGQLWHDASVDKVKAWIGGAWVALDLDTNTSYAAGTAAEVANGTESNTRVWSPTILRTVILSLVTKVNAGLGNVDNTSDANKPISTATATALSTKAPVDSPTFTGMPSGPSPASTDNTTRFATTAMVQGAIAPKAPLASPAFTGTPTAPTPTTGTGIANKDYVDGMVQGLSAKAAVRVATTANITLSGNQTIDGVAVTSGNRVLVKNQTNPAQNGIYQIAPSPDAWFRVTDANTLLELASAFTFVQEGATQADTGWVSTVDVSGTLDTSAINWVQFSAAGQMTAGSGLVKNGNTIGIAVGGITVGMMAASSVDLATSVVTGILPVSKGGTGSTTTQNARRGLQAVGSKPIVLPAMTAGTWTALDTSVVYSTIPQVAFFDTATDEAVTFDWRISTMSLNLEVKADITIDVGTYAAIVHSTEI
jgi:hypothetical protein